MTPMLQIRHRPIVRDVHVHEVEQRRLSDSWRDRCRPQKNEGDEIERLPAALDGDRLTRLPFLLVVRDLPPLGLDVDQLLADGLELEDTVLRRVLLRELVARVVLAHRLTKNHTRQDLVAVDRDGAIGNYVLGAVGCPVRTRLLRSLPPLAEDPAS